MVLLLGVLVLLVVVFALVGLLIPPRPAWALALVDLGAGRQSVEEPPAPAGPGLLDPAAVQERLELVAAEVRRLDEVRDRSVFALAFRRRVAQDAYWALLDDASRIAVVATLELGDVTLDLDDVPTRGRSEELDF